jgi:hypothetical protein
VRFFPYRTNHDLTVSFIQEIVPSSARSSSSAASPLPGQFAPLLEHALENVKEVIQRLLPMEKKLTALEEAEFEDEGGEAGALEREMLSQGSCLMDSCVL